MFDEAGLFTAWHLTDIDNLESIAKHGLLSMDGVKAAGIKLHEVGWSGIRATRDTAAKVLTFVQPYNRFIQGRFDWHLHQHPTSKGLCLLEIDLRVALTGRLDAAEITSGNIATTSAHVRRGPLDKFRGVLEWEPLLASMSLRIRAISSSTADQQKTAGQAEILLPEPIPPTAIRRVWISPARQAWVDTTGLRHFPRQLVEGFSPTKPGSIPSPAIHNFEVDWLPEPVRCEIEPWGLGHLYGHIGTSLQLCRFDQGIRVLPTT